MLAYVYFIFIVGPIYLLSANPVTINGIVVTIGSLFMIEAQFFFIKYGQEQIWFSLYFP